TQVSSSGTITIGGSATDTATISGGFGTPTGSVTFTVYATTDCSGSAVSGFPGSTSISTTTVSGGTATSALFTPASAGVYYWKAVFSDTDGNNNGVTTTCGTTGAGSEILTVNKAAPTVTTIIKNST